MTTLDRTDHPEAIPDDSEEITQKLTREQATEMLAKLEAARKRARLEIIEYCVYLKMLHDLGGYLALGYDSWSEFCGQVIGIDRTLSYRYMKQGQLAEDLRGIGINVDDGDFSATQASLVAGDPEAYREIDREVRLEGRSTREAVQRVAQARSPERDRSAAKALREAAAARVPAQAPKPTGSPKSPPVTARSTETTPRRARDPFVATAEQSRVLDELWRLRDEIDIDEDNHKFDLNERLAALWKAWHDMGIPKYVLAAVTGVVESRIQQLVTQNPPVDPSDLEARQEAARKERAAVHTAGWEAAIVQEEARRAAKWGW